MHPIESYKSLALFAIAILVLGLGFLAIKYPQGIHKTFSQHAAAKKSLIVFYVALFAVTLIPLNLFFIFWFAPTLKLPTLFIIFIMTSSTFQILCTLTPETTGWKVRWHQFLAGVSALLLLPALGILLYSDTINIFGKIISLLGIIIMTIVITIMIIKRNRTTHLLLLQIIYFAAFFAPILSISYVNY